MHGRTGSAKNEDELVRELWQNTIGERQGLQGTNRVRDFLIATFDQRNHGSRKVSDMANEAWRTGNEHHAPDIETDRLLLAAIAES